MHSVLIHRPFTAHRARNQRHRIQHDIQLEIAVRRMDLPR